MAEMARKRLPYHYAAAGTEINLTRKLSCRNTRYDAWSEWLILNDSVAHGTMRVDSKSLHVKNAI